MTATEPADRFVVGLTGGIGSGKSAAADDFAALGAAVVDADLIAHSLTGPAGSAMPAIEAAFGKEVVAPDGRLDRAAMRSLVFADPALRQRLEAILHPLIRQESERRCRDAQISGAPYVVLVVPLLVESADFRQRVRRVAVVDCADEIRIVRVMARSRLARQDVERIMAVQASRAARLAAADDIIDNDGERADLAKQVAALHRRYLQFATNTRKNGISG
jgi:dephospho-CoA kinase